MIVGGRDSQEERQVFGPDFPNGLHDFAHGAGAIFESCRRTHRCADSERGERNSFKQVAVRTVNLDYFEARGESALSGIGEGFHDLLNSRLIQRCRRNIRVAKGNSAGSVDRTPAAILHVDGLTAIPRLGGAGLASGMRELGSGIGALCLDKANDARERFDVLVFPDAKIGRTDAPSGRRRSLR